MKNITIASLIAAGLIATASSCTPVHAADDDYRREYERLYLQSVQSSERAQDRNLRQSDEGYRQLQDRFDRETIRNEQRRLDDNYWRLDKRRRIE